LDSWWWGKALSPLNCFNTALTGRFYDNIVEPEFPIQFRRRHQSLRPSLAAAGDIVNHWV
jgi:hypothetical protein